MSESLKLGEFYPGSHNTYALLDIGGGVIPEMADAFGVDIRRSSVGAALSSLIERVAPNKELQKNKQHVVDVLGDDAVQISRGWLQRAGVMDQVDTRSYAHSLENSSTSFDKAVISGGVLRWMKRRADHLIAVANNPDGDINVDTVLLAGGNRVLTVTDGADTPDLDEYGYLNAFVAPKLRAAGFDVPPVLDVDSGSGNDVMRTVAANIGEDDRVLYVGNAGQWAQGAGQLRRALIDRHEHFDRDGDNFYVTSDGFAVGESGQEPLTTHQNPLSGIGIIPRAVQELYRHSDDRRL